MRRLSYIEFSVLDRTLYLYTFNRAVISYTQLPTVFQTWTPKNRLKPRRVEVIQLGG
jgi:hypothetical protein